MEPLIFLQATQLKLREYTFIKQCEHFVLTLKKSIS